MDFGKAFTYAFEDPDWLKKLVIMGLIFLIPIIGQIVVIGWMLDITRQVIRRQPVTLPDLDFGDQFITGLQGWLITLIYTLPIIIIFIPVWIIGPMMDDSEISTIMGITFGCFTLIAMVYGLLVNILVPAAHAKFAATGELSAGLRLGEVFKLVQSNPGAYLLVLLGQIIVGMIAPLGMILCIVGAVFTSVLGSAVLGHLYGQAYLAARSRPPVEMVDLPEPS